MSGILNLLLGSAAGVIKDAYFNLVTLLLNTTATNGAQNNTFLDSSTNNFSITRNGNTTQGTFTPFSQTGWGNYFDGSSSYLSFTSSANFAFGTGDYTVETWVYLTSSSTYQTMFGSATTDALMFNIYSMNSVVIQTAGSNIFATFSGATFSTNTWYHVAVSRSSGTVKAFVNGAQYGSTITSNTTNYVQPSTNTIGANGASQYFGGYLSNLRVNKGTAVYTSAFTPSTTPLTAISGTQLLTCQSNRFLDNSANAIALTANGSPSVQAFSPFVPTTAYSTSLVGGSGYFDGSGDYLATGAATALDNISGDFTIEYWQYPITGSNGQYVALGSAVGSYSGNAISFVYVPSTNNFYAVFNTTAGPNYTGGSWLNTWTHVAWVRNGSGSNNCTLYLNGVSVATSTYTGTLNLNTTNSNTYIGKNGWDASFLFTGYLSSLRIVKGTAVYTSNFTPPTAPLTAITNTQLLTNFTNAGIFDSAAKNDLETIGNAQVSTTQAKFGTTSVYFDGSGDGLVGPVSNLFDFGSGDFTVEFWANIPSTSGTGYFVSVWETAGGSDANSSWLIRLNNNGTLITHLTQGTGTFNTLTSGTLSTNTWFHCAYTRSGNTIYLFIDGVLAQSASVSGAMNTVVRPLRVGYQSGGNELTGYIDELRITKGYARYTANFTPPAAAFPVQ